MGNAARKPVTLYVEGSDDLHAIANLLVMAGFGMDTKPREVEINAGDEKYEAAGRQALLRLVTPTVELSTDKAVGFVIDADDSAASTWHAVRDRIAKPVRDFGVTPELPDAIPPEGFVTDLPTHRARVGVWIMPDNLAPGMLEHFLAELVTEGDPLLPHARSATAHAKSLGAKFPDAHDPKAVLHAWLAWQKNPGCPFGVAVKARYFDPTRDHARRFVDWVRRLAS